MLVSVRVLPDEFRIQNKMPLSTGSQASGSMSPWAKLPLHYTTAAGNVTTKINNNDPDLTKHAWGLKGLILSTGHFYAIMEWQHAELVHIPPLASGPYAPPRYVALPAVLPLAHQSHSTQPPPYAPQF